MSMMRFTDATTATQQLNFIGLVTRHVSLFAEYFSDVTESDVEKLSKRKRRSEAELLRLESIKEDIKEDADSGDFKNCFFLGL